MNAQAQVNVIIRQMEIDVQNGKGFTAPLVALGRLGKLSLNRLFAFRTLRAKSVRCSLCTRRTAHDHTLTAKGLVGLSLRDYKDVQTALDITFGDGLFKVSNPLFGKTVNITYKGNVPEMVYDMRYFLLHMCQIELDVAKATRRKVAGVINI